MLGLIDLVPALLHAVVAPTSSLLDPCPCTATIVVFGHTHRCVLERPLVPFPCPVGLPADGVLGP
jgi:hypothetical protein